MLCTDCAALAATSDGMFETMTPGARCTTPQATWSGWGRQIAGQPSWRCPQLVQGYGWENTRLQKDGTMQYSAILTMDVPVCSVGPGTGPTSKGQHFQCASSLVIGPKHHKLFSGLREAWNWQRGLPGAFQSWIISNFSGQTSVSVNIFSEHNTY